MYRNHHKTALVFFLLLLPLMVSCNKSSPSSWDQQQYRAAASALYNRELFKEAALMYEKYLHSGSIPSRDIPKVLYQMGNIYLDNLGDPKTALGHYTVLKALFPDETFNNQLGKKIVLCLEKAGRRLDAKQALSSITDLDPVSRDTVAGAKIVAEIDGRKISLNEIEQAVGALPEAPLEREQLVSQYVAQILIADAARRKGIGDRPEVKKRLQFVQNQMLAQESLKEELNVPSPSENDLKYYFEAHKQRYLTGPDSLSDFTKLLPKVQKDWQMEKQNEKYQEYVSELLRSDLVRIYGTGGGTE
ncbi:hypothetical protein ACFL5V_12140 [Fibrobacterota bacterium]